MLDPRRDRSARSWLDETLARFDAESAGLVHRTGALLNRIVPDEALHARFINTLSMLEHMGSHKIMATQHGPAIDQATLKHLAEESQHAFFMKRQAEKAGGRPLEYTAGDLVAPRAARMYFLRLEAFVVKLLERQQSGRAAYLYLSMLVEFRAVWFYRLYQQALKRHGHPLSLKRLLGEEQSHLADMALRLEHAGELSDARVDRFMQDERALYGRLLNAFQHSVS
jgi:hypothetical protein